MPAATNSTAAASADFRSRFGAAYAVLEDGIRARAFPGCAFGVLAGGDVILQDALGRFTYEDDSPMVRADTSYDVASVTKVVATTAAAMLLYQRGRLDLETPLGELLPGFVVGRAAAEHARKVTLRHLLAHNSGLPGYVELFQRATTPAALYRACLELPLEAEPGTRAEYSDPGFILLGKALEVITGEYLAAWVKREVFEVLELKATEFCPPAAARSSIPPTEEDRTLRRRRIQGEVQDEHAWLLKGAAGHAGLFSNVPDLLRFAAEVLKGWSGKTSLFGEATLRMFAERQRPVGSARALGWDTPSEPSSSGQYFSAHSVGHLGYSGCSFWIDLEAAIAVVLLANRTWPARGPEPARLIREIRPAFHDAIRSSI
jgi:CubicO group peptidase (beta-lactamase class C family)